MKKSRIVLKLDMGNGTQRDWVSPEILTPDNEILGFWRHVSELVDILKTENKILGKEKR